MYTDHSEFYQLKGDNEDIIEEQPELAMEQIRHSGAINRVRVCIETLRSMYNLVIILERSNPYVIKSHKILGKPVRS